MLTDPSPASTIDHEERRRQEADKAALKRGELWQRMGCPTAREHMALESYERDYRGRIWCASPAVLQQVQETLKVVLCPQCIEQTNYGASVGTRFYITVEDDVMTVFPAVGHFVCHYCGFEEWQPLNQDPRRSGMEEREVMTATAIQQQMHANQQRLQGIQNAYQNAYQGALGQLSNQLVSPMEHEREELRNRLMKGMSPQDLGAIWGMTDAEKASLYRLYQRNKKGEIAAPPIIESREEAERLARMAPPERRQSMIQKLRDLGII